MAETRTYKNELDLKAYLNELTPDIDTDYTVKVNTKEQTLTDDDIAADVALLSGKYNKSEIRHLFDLQAQAVAAAKKGAQVLMFGVGPQEAHFEMNTYDIYKQQLTIQGSFINPLTFKDAISLLESGKMNVAPLISHELGLEEVQDFLDGKIQGVSKAVVKVGE